MKRLILAILLSLCAVSAQVSIADRFNKNAYTAKALVPASATALVSSTVYIDAIVLTNNSASDVTVTITDRSTDCQSAACAITPTALVVKATSIYVINFPKIEATSGIMWSASAANAVVGRVIGTK